MARRTEGSFQAALEKDRGLALGPVGRPEGHASRHEADVPAAVGERSGDVKNVVFPCGVTVGEDGDTLRLYYGAGDSRVAVASGSISRLLDDLAMNGTAA